MRVLVISFLNSWISHLGTELELAQRHLDDGDTVESLGCRGMHQGLRWQPVELQAHLNAMQGTTS